MKNSLDFYDNIYSRLFRRKYTKKGDRSVVSLERFEQWRKDNPIEINSVIDVGCAWGKALQYWKNAGVEKIVGVDVSDVPLQKCRELGFEVYRTSATDLSMIPNKSFDLYTSTDVYEHIRTDDLDESIEEAKRITNKLLLIRVHPSKDRRGKLHLTVWRLEEWQKFFERHNCKIIPFGENGDMWYYNTFLLKPD